MMQIPIDQNLFHLSYDIIYTQPDDKTTHSSQHEKLKEDIVWEILIASQNNCIVKSPVASTIIFSSPKSFNYWIGKMAGLQGRMHYAFSEVKEDSISHQSKIMRIDSNPDNGLSNNFYTDIILPQKVLYRTYQDTGTPLRSNLP